MPSIPTPLAGAAATVAVAVPWKSASGVPPSVAMFEPAISGWLDVDRSCRRARSAGWSAPPAAATAGPTTKSRQARLRRQRVRRLGRRGRSGSARRSRAARARAGRRRARGRGSRRDLPGAAGDPAGAVRAGDRGRPPRGRRAPRRSTSPGRRRGGRRRPSPGSVTRGGSGAVPAGAEAAAAAAGRQRRSAAERRERRGQGHVRVTRPRVRAPRRRSAGLRRGPRADERRRGPVALLAVLLPEREQRLQHGARRRPGRPRRAARAGG